MKKSLVAVAVAGAGILGLASAGAAAPGHSSPSNHDGCSIVMVGATKAKSGKVVVDEDGSYVVLPDAVANKDKGHKKDKNRGVQVDDCTAPPAPEAAPDVSTDVEEPPARGGDAEPADF